MKLETLSGPGGGPGDRADDPSQMAKADARLGVGAFPTMKKVGKRDKEEPPPTGDSPCGRYEPRRKK
jgi:hypothetical protein